MRKNRAPPPNEPINFHAVSQTAALVVKAPNGTYGGSECGGYGFTKEGLAHWYKNWVNPNNPHKRVLILEYHLYDPKKE